MKIEKVEKNDRVEIKLGEIGCYSYNGSSDFDNQVMERVCLWDNENRKIEIIFHWGKVDKISVTDSKGEKYRILVD